MSILTVGDFTLRVKDIEKETLPLEKIDSVELDNFLVCNRYGVSSNVIKRDLIKLDNAYEKKLWDELMQLEQQILFLTEALREPESFGTQTSIGIVKKTEKENFVIPANEPWREIQCNQQLIAPLTEPRLVQIGRKLEGLESEHEFLTEAIAFLR